MDGGETPGKKQKKRSFSKRCVATAKAVGAGDDEEDAGMQEQAATLTTPPLSLTARRQAIEHV